MTREGHPDGRLDPPRMFTQSRVIALALITPLIAGLAYIRYAPDSSPVSVAECAKPGGAGSAEDQVANDTAPDTATFSHLAAPGFLHGPGTRTSLW
jgi:hypothetical protein